VELYGIYLVFAAHYMLSPGMDATVIWLSRRVCVGCGCSGIQLLVDI